MTEPEEQPAPQKDAADVVGSLASVVYGLGMLGTFIYLTFFDHYPYNWWNWFFILPIHAVLGALWPGYWLFRLLRWLL